MADETAPTPAESVVTNGTNDEAPVAPDAGRREKRQHTPPEELFDLSKPIPRAEKPDKQKHDDEIESIKNSIDALKLKKQGIQNKIDGSLEGGRNSAVGKEKEALKELRNKKGALIKEKNVLRTRMDVAKKQNDNLAGERKAARASMKFSDMASIENEIASLRKTQETTSMSLSQEKRLIKEIDALEASKKHIANVKNTEASMDDIRDLKKSIKADIDAKDKEIDAVQAQIEEKNVQVNALKESEDEVYQNLSALKKERETIKKEIGEFMDKRNTLRDEFREANNKFYDYKRAIGAQKKMQYEEEKKKREEERAAYLKAQEEEELKKIPYEEEMGLCDYLVSYLTKAYLEGDKKETVEKKVEVIAVKDDPFANFKPVNKKTDDTFLQIGKGKKKPRVRASKKNAPPPFVLTPTSFEQFGFLSLSPPTKIEDVEKSIEELKAKKEWYKKQPRGSVPTARDIRKANEKANADKSKPASVKKNGKVDITGDEFAPLSASGSTTAVNATWGQKPAEEETAEEPALEAEAEPSD